MCPPRADRKVRKKEGGRRDIKQGVISLSKRNKTPPPPHTHTVCSNNTEFQAPEPTVGGQVNKMWRVWLIPSCLINLPAAVQIQE